MPRCRIILCEKVTQTIKEDHLYESKMFLFQNVVTSTSTSGRLTYYFPDRWRRKKRILEKWSLIALHFNRARDSLMALMLSNEFETWRVILHEFCVSSPVGEISVLWTDVFHSFQFYGGSRIFYPYMVRSRLVFLKGQPAHWGILCMMKKSWSEDWSSGKRAFFNPRDDKCY